MRALPLWQPWSSLVALGVKRVETRDYPPERLGLRAGQRIAIHATKTDRELRFCERPFFRDHIPDPSLLPLGALIATVTLARAARITEASAAQLLELNPQEYAFGDYTPGRWAWVLADVEALAEPVPFRGSQGAFEVPDELLGLPPSIADDDTHCCPVADCQRRVLSHMLMCGRHWRLVGPNLRSRLYSAWDYGRGAGTDEHQETMRLCIDEAEFKLANGGQRTETGAPR